MSDSDSLGIQSQENCLRPPPTAYQGGFNFAFDASDVWPFTQLLQAVAIASSCVFVYVLHNKHFTDLVAWSQQNKPERTSHLSFMTKISNLLERGIPLSY